MTAVGPDWKQYDAAYPPPPPPYGASNAPPPPSYGASAQPQYSPWATSSSNTVVVTQPVAQVFLDQPAQISCPFCHATVVTSTEYKVGQHAWCMCMVLCFFVGPLCAFLPFCMNSCQDVEHKCPNCKNVVGRYTRDGGLF